MVDNGHFHYWELIFLVATLGQYVDSERTTHLSTILVNGVKICLLTHVKLIFLCQEKNISGKCQERGHSRRKDENVKTGISSVALRWPQPLEFKCGLHSAGVI